MSCTVQHEANNIRMRSVVMHTEGQWPTGCPGTEESASITANSPRRSRPTTRLHPSINPQEANPASNKGTHQQGTYNLGTEIERRTRRSQRWLNGSKKGDGSVRT
jgi:hypothetical protein